MLEGELPHKDFDEIYTGGLSYLHALAFKLLGLRLISLRIVLLGFSVLFVAALYLLAVRLVRPGVAACVVLLGLCWSVPNYFAGVPSWYNLFLATFGTLMFFKYIDTEQRRWLFLAGSCTGVSIVVKITGVYFLAAGVLFLLFREGLLTRSRIAGTPTGISGFLLLKAFGGLCFAGMLLAVLRSRLTAADLFLFAVPGLALYGLVLWDELHGSTGRFATRFGGLLEELLPFGAGCLVPIAVFLSAYAATGSLDDLYRGLFVLPLKRFAHASLDLPPFWTMIAAAPYSTLLVLRPSIQTRAHRLAFAVVLMMLAVMLVAGRQPLVQGLVWSSVRALPAVAALAGCSLLARARPGALSLERRQQLFLILTVAALHSLIQLPFSAPIYFCYTAPLVVLAIVAVVSAQGGSAGRLHLAALAFYLVFAVVWMNTGHPGGRRSDRPDSLLSLDRGGIRVSRKDKIVYEGVISTLRARQPGLYTYAAPDCPEIYFLSGLKNPTRILFDFLREGPTRGREVIELLETHRINAAVINREPEFSGNLNADVIAALRKDLPYSAEVGQFEVRWRR